jgi:hypothetical protein
LVTRAEREMETNVVQDRQIAGECEKVEVIIG